MRTLLIMLLTASTVFSADWVITLTIKEADKTAVKDALFAQYPKQDGFTNEEWVKKCYKKWTRDCIRSYEAGVIFSSYSATARELSQQINPSEDIVQ